MAGTFYQAYVEIIPVAKGFKANLEKELSGLDSVSSKAGSGSGGAFSKGFSSALRGLAVVGTAAVAAIGAGLGATLSKGFERLQGIERARNLLQGIGNDAKTVEEVMANALDAVRGTAFGLDEAAQVAASSVAAGVEPGKELYRYLSLTGDAASITGRNMGELGAIFNKVTAQGKAQNDTLQQLAESGIPIYQYLADELGTTSEAIFGLARDGEISSEMLMTAIETNIAGAALKAGETTQGAFANVGAAISRVGANILGGTFTQLPGFFQDIIESIEPLEQAAKDVGEQLGTSLQPVFTQLIDLIPVIFESIIGFLPLFINAIDIVSSLFPMLLDLILPLIPIINDLAGLFLEMAEMVLPLFAEIFGELVPIFQGLVPSLIAISSEVLGFLVPAFSMLADILLPIIRFLFDNIPTVATFAASLAILTAVVNAQRIATAAWAAIQTVLNIALSLNPIGLVVIAIAALIAGIVYLATKTQFFRTIWEGLKIAFEAVVDWFKSFPATISGFFQAAGDKIVAIWGAVSNWFSEVLGAISGFFQAASDKIIAIWETVSTWFSELPGKILAFFATIPGLLYDAGAAILNGLWEGIKFVFRALELWFIGLFTLSLYCLALVVGCTTTVATF